MVKASISVYGSLNRKTGWNSLEVGIEKKGVTIKDVLKAAILSNGSTLFDLVAEGNRLKESYGIFLSGRFLRHPVNFNKEIKSGDKLVMLDFPFTVGGG